MLKRQLFSVALASLIILLALPLSVEAQETKLDFPLAKVWQFQAPERESTGYDRMIEAEFILSDNYLYSASVNGVLYCLDKITGQLVWSFATNRQIKQNFLLTSGSNITFASGPDIYSLDATSGEIRWLHRESEPINTNLAAHENMLFFATGNSLTALSLDSNDVIWRHELGSDQAALGTLFHDSGYLYLPVSNNKLIKCNASDGAVAWSVDTEGKVRSGIACNSGALFYGSDANYIVRADAGTGAERWRQRVSGDIRSGITYYDDHVYFYSRDRYLRVYNAGHGGPNRFAPFNVQTNFEGVPLIADNHLLIVNNAVISARRIDSNFALIHNQNTGIKISNSMAFDPESKIIYAGGSNGEIAAMAWEQLRIKAPELREEEKVESEPILEEAAGVPELESQLPDPRVTTSNEEEAEENEVAPVEEDAIGNSETASESSDDETATTTESQDVEHSGNLTTENLNPLAEYSRKSMELMQEFRAVKEERYTISIGLFCRLDSLQRLTRRFQEDHRILIFERGYQGTICYFFCIDVFEDKPYAEKLLEEMSREDQIFNAARVYRLDSFIQ